MVPITIIKKIVCAWTLIVYKEQYYNNYYESILHSDATKETYKGSSRDLFGLQLIS